MTIAQESKNKQEIKHYLLKAGRLIGSDLNLSEAVTKGIKASKHNEEVVTVVQGFRAPYGKVIQKYVGGKNIRW